MKGLSRGKASLRGGKGFVMETFVETSEQRSKHGVVRVCRYELGSLKLLTKS